MIWAALWTTHHCVAALPARTVTLKRCGIWYGVSLGGGASRVSGLGALQKALPQTCSVPLGQASWAQRSYRKPLNPPRTSWDSHRTPTSRSCRTGTQPTLWTSTWGICLRLTRRDSANSGMHLILGINEVWNETVNRMEVYECTITWKSSEQLRYIWYFTSLLMSFFVLTAWTWKLRTETFFWITPRTSSQMKSWRCWWTW